MSPLDESGRGRVPLLLLAFGAGATLAVPRAAPPERPALAEPDRRPPAPSLRGGSLAPVIGLLEESLAADPSPESLGKAAEGLHRYLCSLDHPDRRDRQARRATDALWDRIDPAAHRAHLAAPRGCGRDEECAARVLDTYAPAHAPRDGTVDAARQTLATHFLERAGEARRLKALAARGAGRVRFVIATIADYVDSNSGWVADQQIEAIQAAMAGARLSLDRFYLPDWTPGASGTAPPGRRHETEPGAILFRRSGGPDLVAVLLVTETPTGGIHRQAFAAAARLVAAWPAPAGAVELRVLGPTFSGSIPSLREALVSAASVATRPVQARVVSGSANANSNGRALQADLPPGLRVQFESTVSPSADVIQALKLHLGRLNARWADGRGVAILHESNTSFGASVAGLDAAGRDQDARPDCTSGDEAACTLIGLFPEATFVPFPLHISRLRQAAPAASPPPLAGPVAWRALIPMTVRDSLVATDRLPALNAELAAATAQSASNAIFQALRRRHISAVGIVATDERDVMYLVRELRRSAPNVQPFLMGAHLLYTHPEYAPYMTGSLVASTYPLTTALQRWTEAAKPQVQFAGMTQEGIHNAAALLLAEGDPAAGPGLADYSSFSARAAALGHRPPVWISVIGRNAMWPLEQYPAEELPGARHGWSYLHQAPAPAGKVTDAGTRQRPSLVLIGLAAALFAFAAWHLLTVLQQVTALIALAARSVGRRLGRLRAGARRVQDDEWQARVDATRQRARQGLQAARSRAYRRVFTIPAGHASIRRRGHALIFVAFALLGIAVLWASPALLAWIRPLPTSPAWAVAVLLAWTAVPVLLFATHALERDGPDSSRHSSGGGLAGAAGAIGLLLVVVGAGVAWSDANGDSAGGVFRYQRLVAVDSLVSPLVPVLCLAAAGYVFVRWQLDRLSQQGAGYGQLLGLGAGPDTARPLCRLLATGTAAPPAAEPSLPSPCLRLATLVDHPLAGLASRLGRRTVLVLTVTVLAPLLAVLGQAHTLEGPIFTWFFRFASGAVLLALLALLVYTNALWSEVRLLLKRLARSPLSRSFRQVVRFNLDWRLKLSLPHREELAILMATADDLEPAGAGFRKWLEESSRDQARVPLLHCPAFLGAWQHLEQYLPALAQPPDGARAADWARRARGTLALLLAFFIRDLLRRIVSGFTAVSLGLGLVLAAHLLYTFQGRTNVLTIDWVAIALASALAIRTLVQMERDAILSRLWNSTPDRVTFNREFVGRIAVYGALPLLTAVSAIFPEIGDTLFGWLAPARQLAGF